jgi:hypothetical protein
VLARTTELYIAYLNKAFDNLAIRYQYSSILFTRTESRFTVYGFR